MRVGKQGAGHGDNIGMAAFKDTLGSIRHIDAVRCHERDVNVPLEFLSDPREACTGQGFRVSDSGFRV